MRNRGRGQSWICTEGRIFRKFYWRRGKHVIYLNHVPNPNFKGKYEKIIGAVQYMKRGFWWELREGFLKF